jgi:alkanesulfonate monooxygenase SsuD/methylene tetrahydromethanopterin reductase-like flavin-dependent oxidoreductase (luciferase family)
VQDRLPILIGGSGPTKTLRTTARYADLWNGYGDPDRIAEVSDVLRTRCDEIGRPFDDIERTVTIHAVIRDTAALAIEAWTPTAERHGLVDRVGADGTDRELTMGGSPAEVAEYLDGYRRTGVGEVIFVFRHPFDRESIERVGEVRKALEG